MKCYFLKLFTFLLSSLFSSSLEKKVFETVTELHNFTLPCDLDDNQKGRRMVILDNTINTKLILQASDCDWLIIVNHYRIIVSLMVTYVWCPVVSYNWLYNGSFIHPSLHPGLSVLTSGDLSFDTVQPHHAGGLKAEEKLYIKVLRYIFISTYWAAFAAKN